MILLAYQILKGLLYQTKNHSSNFKMQWKILDDQAEFLHLKYMKSIPYSDFMIFESIRKAGATGLHLSRGERSMLDAFQSAAINISSNTINALVPLYEFFPCIESFLDTSVKRSIEQAQDNKGLDIPFDINLTDIVFDKICGNN